MKYTKRPSAVSDRIQIRKELKTLEDYLITCPNNTEKFDFPGDSQAAYEFGNKIRQQAMAEEGVAFPDQLEKFKVDISYETVRISLLIVDELARR